MQKSKSISVRFKQSHAVGNGAKRAFTLIELLIVVAIITILAAIATPNFLQAQVRARVARVHADMRTVATALETYAVDNNAYPVVGSFYDPMPSVRFNTLTSPISYLSSLPTDPFERVTGHNYEDSLKAVDPCEPLNVYLYNLASYGSGAGSTSSKRDSMSYSITSGGPDLTISFPYYAFSETFIKSGSYVGYVYDPTNGTVSGGEIFMRGGAARSPLPGINNL